MATKRRVSGMLDCRLQGCGPVQAQRMRTRIMHHFAAALQDADVILTPTAPMVAPELQ